MHLATRALTLACVALAAACGDQLTTPAGVPAVLQSGASTAPPSNPHVHLLPPLAASRPFTGEFDASLTPEFLVYAGAAAPCATGTTSGCSPLVARLDARVDLESQQYHANWKREKGSAGAHQVAILVAGQVIDVFEIVVTKPGTVPIKVRIEEGALDIEVAVVGVSGGIVSAGDGAATIDIPAGALGTTERITVEEVPPGAADDRVVSPIFEFGPDGQTFATPVTITIAYDPARLPAGVSPRLLRLHTRVATGWQVVAGSTVDTETNTVSGATSHFSSYAVLPAAFASISSGEWHSCGLTSDGTAWCWGRDTEGQLGAATPETCSFTNPTTGAVTNHPCATAAVEVEGGLRFRSIEAGNGHTCAVALDDKAYCWGRNALGQLGTGTTIDSPVPVQAATGFSFTSVSVDHMQTCGLTTAGEVYCWGANNNRQLGSTVATTCPVGTGQQQCSTTPVKVSIPTARAVDVGLGHACALTTADDMYCWGWNLFGQIGTGATSSTAPPTLVPGGPYETMSAGAVHNCMTKAGGVGYCFGTDFMPDGAIGDGAKVTRLTPTAVAGGLSWSQIDASNGNYVLTHTCGVSTAGQAYCWGGNFDGQLGVQTAPTTCNSTFGFAPVFDCALTPNAVSGGLLFRYVTSSAGFVCGYTITGDVYCWGKNDYGQLGNGTRTPSRVPVKVSTSGFAQ